MDKNIKKVNKKESEKTGRSAGGGRKKNKKNDNGGKNNEDDSDSSEEDNDKTKIVTVALPMIKKIINSVIMMNKKINAIIF